MEQKAAKRRERAERKKERRRGRVKQVQRQQTFRMFALLGAVVAVVALAVVGVVFLIATSDILPPTTFGPGHSEAFPPQRINLEPIPRRIQEHVMERGGGHHQAGSMLVQYNCEDYQCEPDLIGQLTDLVQGYPPQVYLAPYPNMDAKIALAAPGRLQTLKSFDKGKIREFINDNLSR